MLGIHTRSRVHPVDHPGSSERSRLDDTAPRITAEHGTPLLDGTTRHATPRHITTRLDDRTLPATTQQCSTAPQTNITTKHNSTARQATAPHGTPLHLTTRRHHTSQQNNTRRHFFNAGSSGFGGSPRNVRNISPRGSGTLASPPLPYLPTICAQRIGTSTPSCRMFLSAVSIPSICFGRCNVPTSIAWNVCSNFRVNSSNVRIFGAAGSRIDSFEGVVVAAFSVAPFSGVAMRASIHEQMMQIRLGHRPPEHA